MMRLIGGGLLVVMMPAVLAAGFVNMEEGARATGMGGAFVAVSDDATAVFWNPAGHALTEGFKATAMRTRIFSVGGLSEDCVAASYGGRYKAGLGVGWTRAGVEDLYSEDTFVFGAGRRLFGERFSVGGALRIYRVAAPGYDYYNDPGFEGSETGYAFDVGMLYRSPKWSIACVLRNLGEPEISLISTTTEHDPIFSEFRLGATYTFREVMLISGEVRRARDVADYYEDKITYYLGTEIWFFDAFALRTGLNRDRATAGVGLRISKLTVDASLLSAGRPGNKYRLSVSLEGLLVPAHPSDVVQLPRGCEDLMREYENVTKELEEAQSKVEAEEAAIADLKKEIAGSDAAAGRLEKDVARLEQAIEAAQVKPAAWTVRKGESLYTIAGYDVIYDDPLKWRRIWRANRDKISDPRLINADQVLAIPRGLPETHTVVQGEDLAKIAGYWEIYGDQAQWPVIYEANRDQMEDPDLIFPGQILRIPR